MIHRIASCLLLILFINPAFSQNTTDWKAEFDKLEEEMDSLSIFFLLDSLINSTQVKYSELNLSVSYNSNVLNAGRDYGTNLRSLSPGITYYHQSGAFLDYSGYFDTDSSISYNQTILSAGYMWSKSNFTLVPNYELWIYHNNDNETRHSLGSSISYSKKYGYVALDYSYITGNYTGHRLIGSVSGNIKFQDVWIFKRIKIAPTASAYFGNSSVLVRFDGNLLETARENDALKDLIFDPQFIYYANNNLLTAEERQQVEDIRHQDDRGGRKLEELIKIYSNNQDVLDYISLTLYQTEKKYGIMNYSFSIPILMQTKHFSYILSYTYSVPVALPGEYLSSTKPTDYFGASVTYRIPFNIK